MLDRGRRLYRKDVQCGLKSEPFRTRAASHPDLTEGQRRKVQTLGIMVSFRKGLILVQSEATGGQLAKPFLKDRALGRGREQHPCLGGGADLL